MTKGPTIKTLASDSETWLSPQVFYIWVLLLIVLRFFHFEPYIDDPHAWRQCDTAFYSYDFYQRGIDLLNPQVCWMGGHGTLALEFPLPEAIIALLYRLMGEHLIWARLVFLAFFLGMCYYFYQLMALWWNRSLAQASTLVLMSLPLGLYYSRAIHIDGSALFFAYGMLFYFCRAVKRSELRDLLWAIAFALPAFLIKVPYVFYLALPMLVYVLYHRAFFWVIRYSWLWLLPIGAFVMWQQHVYQINAGAPDWDYILHYRKFDQNAAWYFGSLAQRLRLYSWWILLKRGLFEVIGLGALCFFIWGLVRSIRWPKSSLIYAWVLGVIIYVLIFFNLNFVHNYYQLPLMAPVAIFAGLGLMDLTKIINQHLAVSKQWINVGLLLLIVLGQVLCAEKTYYQIPHQEIEIGQILREHTPKEALLIVSKDKYDCRNPKLLYRARRRGWSLEEAAISVPVLNRLQEEEGASHWAYIGAELPIDPKKLNFDASRMQQFELKHSADRLYLFRIE